ncbi:MAG: TonB family protein [Polyangiaceae bacterium]|nr:TonB family protein [Polyangiaceae bacterium]
MASAQSVARAALSADASERTRKRGFGRWLSTFAFHGALVGGVIYLRPPARPGELVSISVVESEQKPAPPPLAPPLEEDETPPAAAQPATRTQSSRARAATPAQPNAGSTPSGDGGSSGGVELPGTYSGSGPGGHGAPGAPSARPAPEPQPTTRKSLVSPTDSGDCGEPVQKAKPKSVPQPAYPEAARKAEVSGKVRVEVTVDERGAVVGARVLSGLGHGLDEAALAAARSASVSPAVRCGKPVRGTFVIGMRFSP